MVEVYWGCLIGGVIFAIVAVLLGGFMGGHGDLGHSVGGAAGAGHADLGDHGGPAGTGHWHLDFLKPAVIVGAITAFGGAGIMLVRYSSLRDGTIVASAAAIACVIGAAVYLLYIRPLRGADSSVGYSMKDLVGRPCEVTVSIPEQGFGEVLVRIGNGVVNHTASGDGSVIRRGMRAVVVDIEKGVVVVAPFDPDLHATDDPSLPTG